MQNKRYPADQAGFTLVEVIVALAIMTVLLIAFSSLLLQGRTTMADTADYDRRLGNITAVMEGSTVPEDVEMVSSSSEKIEFDFKDDVGKSVDVTVLEDGEAGYGEDALNGHYETFRDGQGKIQLQRWVPEPSAPEEGEEGKADETHTL